MAAGQPTIDIELGAERLVLDSIPAHARIVAGVDGDQIRLDRVLRGEGAGETARADAGGPYRAPADTDAAAEGEDLDHLIALEASGALEIVLEAESAVRDRADRRDTTAVAAELNGDADDEDTENLPNGSEEDLAIPVVHARGATGPKGAPHPSRAIGPRGVRGRGRREQDAARGDAGASTAQESSPTTDNLELPF